MVRQEDLGMVATRSPSFKSQNALTEIPSSSSMSSRALLKSMRCDRIQRLKDLNLLLIVGMDWNLEGERRMSIEAGGIRA